MGLLILCVYLALVSSIFCDEYEKYLFDVDQIHHRLQVDPGFDPSYVSIIRQKSKYLTNEISYANNKFVCPFHFGDFSDPEDCSSYYVCMNLKSTKKKCPKGTRFDKNLKKCVNKKEVVCAKKDEYDEYKIINFKCPYTWGPFAHPKDCSRFYLCLFGKPALKICDLEKLFDSKQRECKEKEKVKCDKRFNPYDVTTTTTKATKKPKTTTSIKPTKSTKPATSTIPVTRQTTTIPIVSSTPEMTTAEIETSTSEFPTEVPWTTMSDGLVSKYDTTSSDLFTSPELPTDGNKSTQESTSTGILTEETISEKFTDESITSSESITDEETSSVTEAISSEGEITSSTDQSISSTTSTDQNTLSTDDEATSTIDEITSTNEDKSSTEITSTADITTSSDNLPVDETTISTNKQDITSSNTDDDMLSTSDVTSSTELMTSSDELSTKDTFSEATATTETPEFTCPNKTRKNYPHEVECSKFYECKNGKVKLEECETGMLFNAEMGICYNDNEVDCGNRIKLTTDTSSVDHITSSIDEVTPTSEEISSAEIRTSAIDQTSASGVSTSMDEQDITSSINMPLTSTDETILSTEDSTSDVTSSIDVQTEMMTSPDEFSTKDVSSSEETPEFACPNRTRRNYPHEVECSKFYECKGGKTKLGKCEAGMLFNAEIGMCYNDLEVDCGNRIKLATTPVSMMTSDEDVTTPFQCPEARGRFAIESDCSKYYECKDFVVQVLSCGSGTLFHRKYRMCYSNQDVDCESEQTSRSQGTEDFTTRTESVPLKTETSSAEATSLEPTTEDNLPCEPNDESCIEEGEGLIFRCTKHYDMFVHPRNKNLYIECLGSRIFIRNCPAQLHFNDELKVCDYPQ